MPSAVFSTLNSHLREKKRQALKHWFAYLKLLITALTKLPCFTDIIWRGVNKRIEITTADYAVQTWLPFSSCSKELGIVELFLDQTGTLFAIEAINAKDISKYSALPEEKEVILMPGTRICLRSQSLKNDNQRLVVHFKEW
jgi:hypothetical protein